MIRTSADSVVNPLRADPTATILPSAWIATSNPVSKPPKKSTLVGVVGDGVEHVQGGVFAGPRHRPRIGRRQLDPIGPRTHPADDILRRGGCDASRHLACDYLRVLPSRGEIPARRFGRRVLVVHRELQRLLAEPRHEDERVRQAGSRSNRSYRSASSDGTSIVRTPTRSTGMSSRAVDTSTSKSIDQ